MIRFLEALNPWNSCFTATDFDDTLIDISSILKNIDLSSKNEVKDSISSQEKKQLLENAFHLGTMCLLAAGKQSPDKQLSFLLADILRQYAILSFEENYFTAKQILVLALNLHLYSIGVFSECFDVLDFNSLDDLRKQSESKPLLFLSIEQSILSTHIDRCVTLAYTHSFIQAAPKKKLSSLAQTARWLGYCYQHINQSALINSDNELRFSQLFTLSESLFLLIDDEESKSCLADLYFQTRPFMYMRKNPLDIAGTCQLYDHVLFYDASQEMQARIANQRFLILFSNGRKSEAFPFIQQALLLAETLTEHDKHRFLLASIYDNYASYLMEPESIDLEQAEIYLTRTSQYAAQCRAEGKDRLQFALYDIRLAEFKCVTGKFNEAKEIIERALQTLQKHPQSQEPQCFKAEALKSLINKALITAL